MRQSGISIFKDNFHVLRGSKQASVEKRLGSAVDKLDIDDTAQWFFTVG